MSRLLSRQIKQWEKLRLTQSPFCRYVSGGIPEKVEAPMLLRLRSELKTAMKAKDRERLNVIKGVLAHITNSEKTNQPVDSDEKIRKFMLKQAVAQKVVAQQFGENHRNDLQDKELSQVAILEGYAAEVKVAGEDKVRDAISKTVETLDAKGTPVTIGNIIKVLREKDGPLSGDIFDSDQAIQIVKELGVANTGSKKA